MRSLAKTLMALALFSASAVLAVVGCENTAGDCELTAECTGAPGVAAPKCDPSTAAEVADTCGVFVSASAMPGGTGSRSSPFNTLTEALDAASQSEEKRVYACAETFAENVVVPAALTLYGGLDCAGGWKLDEAARTTILPASGIPIRFEAGDTTHLENVSAIAPDGALPDPASANPRSGGSSIAAFAEPGATVELVRCDLEAGFGASGANGETPASMLDGPGGMTGDDACGSGLGAGGPGGTKMCGDIATSGGEGGSGGDVDIGLQGQKGFGPIGGKEGGPQLAMQVCSDGGLGASGDAGMPGKAGAALKGLLGTDLKGTPGTAGTAGTPGSGGGGGGGGIKCAAGTKGAGGGGGGAGGCGGGPGTGGGAGGSSIALWAVAATVSMTDGKLIAKDGGRGGTGGDGQKGGAGGSIGMAGTAGDGSAACNGGPGGTGGDGGPGGGGEGGSSVGAVWQGTPPQLSKTTLTLGSAGNGGSGGTGAPATATGANGSLCAQLDGEKGTCAAP